MTILVTIIIPSNHLAMVEALKRRSPLHSDVIEEVEAKRLDNLIQEQDYIAVFFCKFIIV